MARELNPDAAIERALANAERMKEEDRFREPLPRVLSWFSCGVASAVTAKLVVEKYGDQCEVLYCDTFAYEHPDNRRFFSDVEKWLGREIKILRSEEYADIYDVFQKTRWLVGQKGARCTTELKKNVRKAYQRVDDIHAFGFTADEAHRVNDFTRNNHELFTYFPLLEAGLTKADCYRRIQDAGIEMPTMYKLGYKNNNCMGCVKGGMGYWNKIRRDFPAMFDKMAKMERELDHSINSYESGKRGKPKTTRRTRDGSLENDHWATPKYLYDELNAEFHFDFDPCPLRSSFDGLARDWGDRNFVNPPYNRVDKPKFIQKAFEEWKKGKTSVLLIPAAVSTKQFHELILPHAEVRFLRGRVGFVGDYGEGKKKGKHDSMIVIFRGKNV